MNKFNIKHDRSIVRFACAVLLVFFTLHGFYANPQPASDYHEVGASNSEKSAVHTHIFTPAAKDLQIEPGAYANYIGIKKGVPVIEVHGNFDAGLHGIRAEVAKEFYKKHQDVYDFLVYVSSFEFDMGEDVLGFHSSVRNSVSGIGKDKFDNSELYGSQGRLQATIDMGPAGRMRLDPLDNGFNQPLATFVHEVMHQWGSYISFKDADGNISRDLIGYQDAHWSYLFDSGASIMLGQSWRNNGDGTFTAIAGRQYLAPIDLYLMGMIGKEEVAPMTLLVAPDQDPTKINGIGDTIRATPRIVTIDDIIAGEGERIPSVQESQKDFRFAFILLVRPGEEADDASITAINRLKAEAGTRFSAMTRGMATANSAIHAINDAATGTPNVFVTEGVAATELEVAVGLQWLRAVQKTDGRWGDIEATSGRDTMHALIALRHVSDAVADDTATNMGMDWLRSHDFPLMDYMARKVQVLGRTASSSQIRVLLDAQNHDGGWGFTNQFTSSPLDTVLVLQALTQADSSTTSAAVGAGVEYLLKQQNPDGGWPSNAGGTSQLTTTAQIITLPSLRLDQGAQSRALAFLATGQREDGGLGRKKSTAHETAEILIALTEVGRLDVIDAEGATAYLSSQQRIDGSWDGSVYSTSVAVRSIAGSGVANWAVEQFTARQSNLYAGIPAELTLVVKNTSGIRMPESNIRIFDQALEAGGIPVRSDIMLPALQPGARATIEFPFHTLGRTGALQLVALVDPDQLTDERIRTDNSKSLILDIAPAQPGIDLLITNEDLKVTPSTPNSLPATLAMEAMITNAGSLPAEQAKVVVWEGSDAHPRQGIVADTTVSVDAQSQQRVSFEMVLNRSGTTVYTVEIDPDNAIGETNKDNNSASVKVQTISAIDVAVTAADVQIAPDILNAGVDSEIRVQVRNIGTLDTASFKAHLFINDNADQQVLHEQINTQLSVGENKSLSFRWRPTSEGQFRIRVELDPEQVLPEGNRANNQAELFVNVGEQFNGPNLSVNYKDISVMPEPVASGQPTQIVSTIRNTGLTDAPAFDVEFYLGNPDEGGELIATQHIDGLDAGHEKVLNIDWQDPRGQGQNLLYVVLDRARHVSDESQLSDNRAFIVFEMLSLPDFAISRADVTVTPIIPKPGDTLKIQARILNIGDLYARNIKLALYEGNSAIQPNFVQEKVVPQIEGKSSHSVEFEYLITGSSELNVLSIVIDPDDDILELSKNNNKVIFDIGAQDQDFYVDQKYFSPNGDGIKDEIQLIFRLPQASDIYIDVVRNDNQRVVRKVKNVMTWNAVQTGQWAWDGRDDRGVVVKDGVYTIRVNEAQNQTLGMAEVVVDNNRSSVVDAIATEFGFDTMILDKTLIDPSEDVQVLYMGLEDRPISYIYEKNNKQGQEPYYRVVRIDGKTGAKTTILSENFDFLKYFEPGVTGDRLVFVVENKVFVTNGYGKNKTEIANFTDGEIVGILSDAKDESIFIAVNYHSEGSKIYSVNNIGTLEYVMTVEDLYDRWWIINQQRGCFTNVSPTRDRFIFDIHNVRLVDMGNKEIIEVDSYAYYPNQMYTHWSPNGEYFFRIGTDIPRPMKSPLYENIKSRTDGPEKQYLLIFNKNGEKIARRDIDPSYRTWNSAVVQAFWNDTSDGIFIYEAIKEECSGINCFSHGITYYDFNNYSNTRIYNHFISEVNHLSESMNEYLAPFDCAADLSYIPLFDSQNWDDEHCNFSVNRDEGMIRRFSAIYPFNLDKQIWFNGERINTSDHGSRVLNKNFDGANFVSNGIFKGRLDERANAIYYEHKSGGKGNIWVFTATHNLEASLRVSRLPGARAFRISGTADDLNFLRYTLEYRRQGDVNWQALIPASDTSVRRGFLVNSWVPPGVGRYEARLTVEDLAGNSEEAHTTFSYSMNPSITDFMVSPKYISPNGDGVQDELLIEYRVLEPVNFDIEIYNENNELVRTIERNHSEAGTKERFAWNGRDDSDNVLADGKYRVVAIDYDFTFFIDNTPPSSINANDEILLFSSPFAQYLYDRGVPCVGERLGAHRSWELNIDGDHACVNKNPLEWNLKDENPDKLLIQGKRLNDTYWITLYEGKSFSTVPINFPSPMNYYEYEYRLVAQDNAGNKTVVTKSSPEDAAILNYSLYGKTVRYENGRLLDYTGGWPHNFDRIEYGSTFKKIPVKVSFVIRNIENSTPFYFPFEYSEQQSNFFLIDDKIIDLLSMKDGGDYEIYFEYEFAGNDIKKTRKHRLNVIMEERGGERGLKEVFIDVMPGVSIDFAFYFAPEFESDVKFDFYLKSDSDLRYAHPVKIIENSRFSSGSYYGDFRACVDYTISIFPFKMDENGDRIKFDAYSITGNSCGELEAEVRSAPPGLQCCWRKRFARFHQGKKRWQYSDT